MITQEQIQNLLNDLAYLEYETEALKYVIDTIPYGELQLPSGRTLIEGLAYIDFIQHEYYRKIIEKALEGKRPVKINDFESPEEAFEPTADLLQNPQKILSKIAKHRTALIVLLQQRAAVEWNREIIGSKTELNIYNFMLQMLREERKILKEIAETVSNYQVSKSG